MNPAFTPLPLLRFCAWCSARIVGGRDPSGKGRDAPSWVWDAAYKAGYWECPKCKPAREGVGKGKGG